MALKLSDFKPIIKGLPHASYYSTDKRVTSNIYLFEHDGRRIVVDSGDGKDGLPFTPDACFLTHGHYDHAGGVKSEWSEVYLHPSEDASLPYMNVPKSAKSMPFGSFDFGPFHFELLHTPGHTPGSMCLFEANNGILLSGDTLFANGAYGRLDIGGEYAAENMRDSLEVLSYVEWTALCPGHGELEFRKKQ